MVTIRVAAGNVTAEDVREAWRELLESARDPESTEHRAMAELGVDSAALEDDVDVDERHGDFGATLVIVFAGPVAVHIVKSLWDDFVRPRLQKRGKDVGGDTEVDGS